MKALTKAHRWHNVGTIGLIRTVEQRDYLLMISHLQTREYNLLESPFRGKWQPILLSLFNRLAWQSFNLSGNFLFSSFFLSPWKWGKCLWMKWISYFILSNSGRRNSYQASCYPRRYPNSWQQQSDHHWSVIRKTKLQGDFCCIIGPRFAVAVISST